MSDRPTSASTIVGRLGPPNTLVQGVALLMLLTVLQRVVGFGRGLLFCRWMSPEELGAWEMSFSFFMLAGPIAVLSLPGVFGRYLEYHRARGQLQSFFRRITGAVVLLGTFSVTGICVGRHWFSQIIFGRPDRTHLVLLLAAGLVAILACNFLTDLFTALRQQRIASRLQLINTTAFAVIGTALLALWEPTVESVIVAYSLSSMVAVAAVFPLARRVLQTSEADASCAPLVGFWQRLLPYALSIWATNWLTNLFALVDRYMIVHYSGLDPAEAMALVGQYHSARLAPIQMLMFASLLGNLMMPHLMHDWESGRRAAVSNRLNLVLKILTLVLVAAGAIVLVAAPSAFTWIFRGKYSIGLSILPCTMAYCIWSGIGCIARTYLWCDERVGLSSLAYSFGLGTNVVLNLFLLPRYGLSGAVLSTTAGYLVSLVLLLVFSRLRGMHIQPATLLLAALPGALCFGGWIGLATVTAAVALAVRTTWLLNGPEKQQLFEIGMTYWHRLQARRIPAAAASSVVA